MSTAPPVAHDAQPQCEHSGIFFRNVFCRNYFFRNYFCRNYFFINYFCSKLFLFETFFVQNYFCSKLFFRNYFLETIFFGNYSFRKNIFVVRNFLLRPRFTSKLVYSKSSRRELFKTALVEVIRAARAKLRPARGGPVVIILFRKYFFVGKIFSKTFINSLRLDVVHLAHFRHFGENVKTN